MNDATDKAILTVVIIIALLIGLFYMRPWRSGYFVRTTRSVPVYTETVRTTSPSSHTTSTVQTGTSSTTTTTTTVHEGETTVCTMEARQCPDGSYVGRSGPQCAFAPCPGPTR